MPIFYTGVGSRETPEEVCRLFTSTARLLSHHFTLRSGGARGADDAFEKGCLEGTGAMEIFLPWEKFNGRKADCVRYYSTYDTHRDHYEKARRIASKTHPAWEFMQDGGCRLHTRNVHQLLGLDVDTPSQFVLCYSADNAYRRANYVGGTGTVLRLATGRNILIFNVAEAEAMERFQTFMATYLPNIS